MEKIKFENESENITLEEKKVLKCKKIFYNIIDKYSLFEYN